MSALLDQLRTLRKQAGVAAAPVERPVVPDDLRKLLGMRMALQKRSYSHDRLLPGVEIAPGVLYLEKFFAFDNAPEVINAEFARMGRIEHQHCLYFDTETTGLSGGTGTRAFMIGAADWLNGQLRVRQLYLTTMGGEAAMLREFATWLNADTVLVSYNGRCYDSPLLKTRYRLARLPDPISGLRHLDLLFPTRRFYRGVYENCKLSTIEHKVLGIVREDDLPGSEAPRAWRDYLRGESARDFRRVIQHNSQDMKSLHGLLMHLAEV
ncbi:MAG: ribonuclease H-like domain-containing protein [Arenimonas sp.]